MQTLAGRTVIVTGASRGIGRAIALRAARDGARVVVAAKSVTPRNRLPGTIHETVAAIEAAGGTALAARVDVRDDAQIAALVQQTVDRFGGIDIVVNNAGAIWLAPLAETPMKRFDLMFDINVRAVYALSRACLPALRASDHAHILNVCPPIDLAPHWFARHTGYTTSKYATALLTHGLSAELRGDRIAVNGLWPRSTIDTAAVSMLGGAALRSRSRTPDIMADAFHAIVTRPPTFTDHLLLDEDVLREAGQTDFERYAIERGQPLQLDLFVDGGEHVVDP